MVELLLRRNGFFFAAGEWGQSCRRPLKCSAPVLDNFLAWAFAILAALVVVGLGGRAEILAASSDLASNAITLGVLFDGLAVATANLVADAASCQNSTAMLLATCINGTEAAASLVSTAAALATSAGEAQGLMGGTGHALGNLARLFRGPIPEAVDAVVLSLAALACVAVGVGIRAAFPEAGGGVGWCSVCTDADHDADVSVNGAASAEVYRRRRAGCCGASPGCCKRAVLGSGARGKRAVLLAGSLVLALLAASLGAALPVSVAAGDLCAAGSSGVAKALADGFVTSGPNPAAAAGFASYLGGPCRPAARVGGGEESSGTSGESGGGSNDNSSDDDIYSRGNPLVGLLNSTLVAARSLHAGALALGGGTGGCSSEGSAALAVASSAANATALRIDEVGSCASVAPAAEALLHHALCEKVRALECGPCARERLSPCFS